MATTTLNRAHGFVWPEGTPPCAMCTRPASDPVHVTPARTDTFALLQLAADGPVRAHAYVSRGGAVERVPCRACGRALRDSTHGVGMPSGTLSQGPGVAQTSQQRAFVAEVGHRLVLAAPVTTDFAVDTLPRQTAEAFTRASVANPNNVWIAGRYVEADRPNRNAAFWSTADLEMGEPTVAHGPINWLHEERHVIGAIAASELVRPERQAAAEGVGNHIVVLGAIWPYLWPQESRVVQQASEAGKLFWSMECVSREVACLVCERTLAYRDYMTAAARCEHMNQRQPRRFVDPVFGGAAVIVPPVRPGWGGAEARVMPQAAQLADDQAGAFPGLSHDEAEQVVAQILAKDFSDKDRSKLAGQGKAMPGGRFPIESRADLANAIHAVGRAKGGEAGRAAVRRHIISRAKALGLSGMIPDNWATDGSLKG